MSETLQVTGDNAVVLSMLADQCGISVEAYLEQSAWLGITLAQIALRAQGESTFVVFQQPDGSYERWKIEFGGEARPESSTEMNAFEALFEDKEKFLIDLDPTTLLQMEEYAAELGISRANFLEGSIGFRHQWAVTRAHNGRILIDDGSSEDHQDYYVVEADNF